MKIFLAGATGAIGNRLVPLLLKAGHRVTGTTRSVAKGEALRAAGVEPAVVDVFDALALSAAVLDAHPDIIIHQLTDLPPGLPHCEDDPLDIDARGTRAITVAGVATLERLAISSPPIDGVVLRYGHLYGPRTGARTAEAPALHVDAAAAAAVLALEKAQRGIYNIAEPSGYLSTEKAQRELGFDAGARLNAAA
jgi:nucleoside-diphosphate-sugar epimerase